MKDLLEEIADYWTTRTEGYSEVNQKELQGMQKEAWLLVLEEHFPDKNKEEIKILDIGTGPGFFPVILSEAGYQITAVDYTEQMLVKARENAGELTDKIEFRQMDAQNLEFEDEKFDVVISRNLTWNLQKPDQAYREWFRVLKPGGILLNFDANWYGYLYDEEKRQAYEKDRENVEKESLDDHYLCTDIDRMEKIALQVPLSAKNRPVWDEEVLTQAGFASLEIDTEIWQRVWSTEEKLNYQSTPMFMICAKKADVMKIGGLEVKPGERVHGFITIGDGEFELPATIIRGNNPGKTVLVTAGVHGGEYVGVQAAVELSQDLSLDKLNGTVIFVKAVSREGFENRQGSVCTEDGKNLNRQFPGDKNGTKTDRLAYAIVEELHSIADYYIDLHGGDTFEELTPYVYYAGKASEEVVKMSRFMAEQVDVPYMVKSEVAAGGSYNYAASCGVPSILLERGGMGTWTDEEVKSTKRDIRNILRELGLYTGHKSYRSHYPLDVQDIRYQSTNVSGLWYPERKVGDLIQAGEILGFIKDYQGNTLEICRADYTGVILFQAGSLQVIKDGTVVTYGKISYEKDERKDKIASYWTKRSDSFLEQRRAELHCDMAQKWMKEIGRFLPKGKKLNILDVGCGTGFFTILLAKEGHTVTGVDLTPDMIKNSRILAKEEGAECTFEVMDAEHLSFEDEAFDMIITRNLTWTLPDAAQGYRDWSRVLKKGGFILNFDANYGASNFADTKELPENHAHNTLGNSLMQECENIKRQLPISSYARPAWDVETLGKLGFDKISLDLGISKRIYEEVDEFYNPTPLFMIYAEKSESLW